MVRIGPRWLLWPTLLAALQALGDLFGFPSASRFTEEWLEDAEGTHGSAYREAVAERLAKLRRIMRDGDGDPTDPAEALEHSSEACAGTPPAYLLRCENASRGEQVRVWPHEVASDACESINRRSA